MKKLLSLVTALLLIIGVHAYSFPPTPLVTGLTDSSNVAITGGNITGLTNLSTGNLTVSGAVNVTGATWTGFNVGTGTIGNLTSTNANITGGTITGITDLLVADGGTGASTLTDHGVLVGSGTDAITALSVGATGTILAGTTGADPSFTATPLGLTSLGVTTLNVDHIAEQTGSHGVVFDNITTFSNVAKTAQGANIASATTTDLSTATGNYVHITGTTTITGFGTVTAGTIFYIVFDGVLTVTHNGTSLICPGAKNIQTVAGARMIIISEGSGNWRVMNYLDGTTSVFARATPISHGATEAANAYDLYGKTHLVTGAYTVTLPAVAVGMHGRFYATTAAAFSVDCNGADHFVLSGTALTAGYKVTSSGGAGDFFEWECTAANTITIYFSNVTFTDGGA